MRLPGVRGGGGESRATGRTQQVHTLPGVQLLEAQVSGMSLVRSTRPHTELRRGPLPIQNNSVMDVNYF